MTDIIDAAMSAVEDRADNHGAAEENFRNIAALWSMVLGVEVAPLQVALCMKGLKFARLCHDINDVDSWVDDVGYSICADKIGLGGGGNA